MSLAEKETTTEKETSTANLYSKKHVSSLLFFLISVFSNFTIQYNVFEFNKLQWAVLLAGGVMLWLVPFIIEKVANKMITTLVFGVLNLIFYFAYMITPLSESEVLYTLYVLVTIVNTLLLPLMAVQAVEDAVVSELELAPRKLSRKNKIPVQRLFWAILVAGLFGIPTGYLTSDAVMGVILFFFNLLSFGWFVYEHGSEYRALLTSKGRAPSGVIQVASSRLIVDSEEELMVPIATERDDLERAESEMGFDWKIVCSQAAFDGFVSKLPALFYYSFYWCLLTVVLIYMYQLSCQFSYSKKYVNPSYLRVYPLLFTVVSYPMIEWKLLPWLKVHKTFHKLFLSTVCAVLALVVATILESFRVRGRYGEDFYYRNPFTDSEVSSCPADLYSYCNEVPYNRFPCSYPPMMSTQLPVGWPSIQFLILSFSISLTGSCFIDFCFYEFFPSSPFMSISLSTGVIRVLMSAAIFLQYYDGDSSKLTDYLTFNLNEADIPILLVYLSFFIFFFLLYLFIEYFPFQQYCSCCFEESSSNNAEESTHFFSSAPPAPYNPVPIQTQPEAVFVPATDPALTKKNEKFDLSVKPLKDLTAEQTVLFFKSVGCLGIEEVLSEKQIVLTGKDLNNIDNLEDLLALDLNLPRIKVRTILEEILHCKKSGVRMSNL